MCGFLDQASLLCVALNFYAAKYILVNMLRQSVFFFSNIKVKRKFFSGYFEEERKMNHWIFM